MQAVNEVDADVIPSIAAPAAETDHHGEPAEQLLVVETVGGES